MRAGQHLFMMEHRGLSFVYRLAVASPDVKSIPVLDHEMDLFIIADSPIKRDSTMLDAPAGRLEGSAVNVCVRTSTPSAAAWTSRLLPNWLTRRATRASTV